jgi:serralysin
MRARNLILAILSTAVFMSLSNLSPGKAAHPEQRAASQIFFPIVIRPPDSFAVRVVELVNQQRTANGCSQPLASDTALTNAAMAHSTDMALHDYFSHTGLDGSSPATRASRAGYTGIAGWENIAAGYPTPEDAVNAWMGSSGHRSNILNCTLNDTGVGYYYLANDTGSVNYHHYWTQMFGKH